MYELKKYLTVQIKRIEIDKWYEGIRIKNDPGRDYVLSWIEKKSSWFRSAWEESLCAQCARMEQCGYEVLNKCDNYECINPFRPKK